MRTSDNPEGVPGELIEAEHEAIARDFPRWITENQKPFFTPNTPQATRTWIKNMMLSVFVAIALASRRTIADPDTRDDLRKISTPTLILHEDADVSAPLAITGEKTAKLLKNSSLLVYAGGSARVAN